MTLAATLVVGGAVWIAWSSIAATKTDTVAPSRTPVETLQRELLEENIGKPGDPKLGALYQSISSQHFGSGLPAIPVRWEPDLARIGPLVARAFTLKGMFGHLRSKSVILLNPDLGTDEDALRRALCHEMVHAYLNVTGDSSTDHGPAFQAVLQRLAKEGAFEGIPATDDERARLRTWLDAESARLDGERHEMARLGEDLEQGRLEVERALADLDTRLAASRESRGAAPSEGDVAAAVALRDAYNRRATEANARSERNRADLDHFNREVERYNLMLVYPDGIEAHAQVTPKDAPARPSTP